jgi:hypothetical protein
MLVVMVVLPLPPFELMTNVVCMGDVSIIATG